MDFTVGSLVLLSLIWMNFSSRFRSPKVAMSALCDPAARPRQLCPKAPPQPSFAAPDIPSEPETQDDSASECALTSWTRWFVHRSKWLAAGFTGREASPQNTCHRNLL